MIYHTAGELEQRNGRAARPSEIAERLGVDVEVVIEGLAAQGAGVPAPWTNRKGAATGRPIEAGSAARWG